MEKDEKYKALYETARELMPHQALKFAREAENDEERFFYAYIMNMNLRRRQKEVIDQNLF